MRLLCIKMNNGQDFFAIYCILVGTDLLKSNFKTEPYHNGVKLRAAKFLNFKNYQTLDNWLHFSKFPKI